MKINFEPINSVTLEEIDRVISQLEGLLEGNLDIDNIADNGTILNIPTDSVIDIDNYYQGEVLIGTFDNDLYTSLFNLEKKLNNIYDVTSVNLHTVWTFSKEIKSIEGTVSTKRNDASPSMKNSNEHAERGGYAYAWVLHTWSQDRLSSVDKATDFDFVTYEKFFGAVFDSMTPDIEITVSREQFITDNIIRFNVFEDDFAVAKFIHFTCAKTNNALISLSDGKISQDSESLSKKYSVIVGPEGSTEVDADLAFNIDIKEHFLLNRMI